MVFTVFEDQGKQARNILPAFASERPNSLIEDKT